MSVNKSIGSRAQVMHGNANKTSGGLTKKQLKYNKQGKIVSRKASALAKKNNRLVKAGYVTKKGVFGNRMMKGGGIISPSPISSTSIKTLDNDVSTTLLKYLAQTTFHPIYEYDIERIEDIEQKNIPYNVEQDVSLILTHKEYNQLFDTENDTKMSNTFVLLYFEHKSENKIPCFNIKLKSNISPDVTLQQKKQIDWLLGETYSKIIQFIKDNLENNKWLDLFKNWNMKDSIKGKNAILFGIDIEDVFIQKNSGTCYRAGTFSDASLQLQYKLGGLLSPLVLYCYLRARGETTNNIKQKYQFIYDIEQGLSSNANSVYNKRSFNIISLEGHLDSGGTYLPHFYQSSNLSDNPSIVFTYAHSSREQRKREGSTNKSVKVPYLLQIELSDTLIGMQSDSENDCILPPFIPFDRIRFNKIPTGCSSIECIADVTYQTRTMLENNDTMLENNRISNSNQYQKLPLSNILESRGFVE
jgi:hypothetical protein